jgi:hypothetical protein
MWHGGLHRGSAANGGDHRSTFRAQSDFRVFIERIAFKSALVTALKPPKLQPKVAPPAETTRVRRQLKI